MVQKWSKYTGALLLLVGVGLPIWLIDRTQSAGLMCFFFVAFVGYALLWRTADLKWSLGVGLLARLSLFATMPMLSDDVYRFLWDGFLLKAGVHPFAELPAFYVGQGVPGLSDELFALLNSPKYFTVYPPINQGLFWLAVSASEEWLVATGVLRVVLLLADVFTFLLLRKWLLLKGGNERWALLLFLNPLLIVEGVGNVHFEGLMLMWLVLALYFLEKTQMVRSAASLGLAIGTKLLPLILLPFFFFKTIGTRKWWYVGAVVGVAGLTLLPLWDDVFVQGMRESLGLYFQNFEFNSSIFTLTDQGVRQIAGRGQIKLVGVGLAALSTSGILLLSWIGHKRQWPVAKTALFIWTIYLLFASTVHPWYIVPLLGLGIMAGYAYPLVWSFFILLTYIGYATPQYHLWPGWLLLEYLMVVLAFIFNNRIKSWLTIS